MLKLISILFALTCAFSLQQPIEAATQPFVARSIVATSIASIWPSSLCGDKGSSTSSLPKSSKFLSFPQGSSGGKQYPSSDDERLSSQRIVPRFWAHILYVATALSPAWAVLQQAYNVPFFPKTGSPTNARRSLLSAVRLINPRVTFAIGSLLRALQLSTALRYVFDPTIGVGAGLNVVCSYVAQSQWPGTIVLGWTMSEIMWKILGARPPSHRLPQVPISLSVTRGGSDSTTKREPRKRQQEEGDH